MTSTTILAHGATPKPARVKDKDAIKACRKDFCEHCGTTRGPFQVHHIKSRGAGGGDVDQNLINLCLVCHDRAHWGHIARKVLERITRAREGHRWIREMKGGR